MKKILGLISISALLASVNAAALTNAAPIGAGDIAFATLNTDVNGSKPDRSIDATITDGKFKGARLHGKLVTAKGELGDPDQISLHFTSMDMHGHTKPVTIIAYAIDVNTAKTVLRSKVDAGYLQKNSALLATSFLQSYAPKSHDAAPDFSRNSRTVKIVAGTDVGVLFSTASA